MFAPPNKRKKKSTSLQTWFTVGLICVVAVVFLAVFISIADDGASTFLSLTDTPNTYLGQGSKYVAVNAGATGLEFVSAGSASQQNLWATFVADSGNTTASSPTDTFIISGGANITTAIVGDTVTITGTGGGSGTQSVWLTMIADTGSATATSPTDSFTIAGGSDISTTIAGSTVTLNYTGGTTSGKNELWELNDTNTGTNNASAADGQALVWDNGNSWWEPGTVSAVINYAQTVTVDEGGDADFTSVQSAINSISDATTSKRYAVLVYAGEYAENITMKDYVDLVGFDPSVCRITPTSGSAITFSNISSNMINIGVYSNYGTLGANTDAVVVTSGVHRINNCVISVTKSGGDYLMTAIDMSNGVLLLDSSYVDYDITGATVGSALIQRAIDIGGSSVFQWTNDNFDVDSDDTNDALTGFFTVLGSSPDLALENSIVNVTNTGSGTAVGLYLLASGGDISINNNEWHVSAVGNAIGGFIDSVAGGAVAKTHFNHIEITSVAGIAYAGSVDTGDTWNSWYDVIDASGGSTGNGTINIVSSGTPGTMTVSGVGPNRVVVTDGYSTLQASGSPTSNTYLKWNGSSFVWDVPAGGGGTPTFQAVTDAGNTTTNPIQFAGGTVTADITMINTTISGTQTITGVTYLPGAPSNRLVQTDTNSLLSLVGSPTANSYLQWNGTSYVWSTPSASGTPSLWQLPDVNTGTSNADASEGDALVWDSGSSMWIPGTVSSSSALWELTDTNTGTNNASASDGNVLTWDAGTSMWIPGTSSGSTPNLQQVTDAGNTTTNPIQFAGGTSTATLHTTELVSSGTITTFVSGSTFGLVNTGTTVGGLYVLGGDGIGATGGGASILLVGEDAGIFPGDMAFNVPNAAKTAPITAMSIDGNSDNPTVNIGPVSSLNMMGSFISDINYLIGDSDPIRIGSTGTPSHLLVADNDLFVTGDFEVDGTAYFDSSVNFYSGFTVDSGTANMNGNDLDNVNVMLGDGASIRIGDGSPSHGSNEDSLYVTDYFEVDGVTYLDGTAWFAGNNYFENTGSILVEEKAASTVALGGWGEYWVKNESPNTAFFRDDTGQDFNLLVNTGTRNVMLTPAGAIPNPTTGPSKAVGTTTDFTYSSLNYDPDTDEDAYWEFNIPDNLDPGGIIVTVKWISTATTGDVVWAYQTVGISDSTAWDSSLSPAQSVTTTVDPIAEDLNTSTFTAYNPGWNPNEIIIFKVYRDANNASDTMTTDAIMTMVQVDWKFEEENIPE